MSLSTLLAERDVKDRFRSEFKKPKLLVQKELLAPAQSARYALVGTAFDYLLRFYLQCLNPQTIRRRWVAEAGLRKLACHTVQEASYDIYSGALSLPRDDGSLDMARRIFDQAWIAHERYLATGLLTDDVLKGAIYLAQLDTIFRCGYIDPNLGIAYRADIRDLRRLIDIVNPDDFLARETCLLNPTFGDASRLVGGADADLFIDGTLIDIKTVKHCRLEQSYFNQLIGYFVLHELSGIGKISPKPPISRLAIYFARHAHLAVWPVDELIDRTTFPGILRWFSERAEQHICAVVSVSA